MMLVFLMVSESMKINTPIEINSLRGLLFSEWE